MTDGARVRAPRCVSQQPYTSRHAKHEAHRHNSRNHTKSVRTVLVNQFAQRIQNQKFLELLRLRCAISWLTDAGLSSIAVSTMALDTLRFGRCENGS